MKRPILKLMLAAVALALSVWWAGGPSELAAGEHYEGKVERVIDGDTISVLTTDYERIRIRLYGIDAPEKKQNGGAESSRALSKLIDGRQVQVEVEDVDRYNRLVALVTFKGSLINLKLVEDGQAWVYDRYCIRQYVCQKFKEAEKRARQAGVGLWRDQNAIAPWDYRQNR
ncbi:MAG: thermonuclease family protein [Deltaproteobacteria bacterium]|nr:thermonuclease family protein [Deltaproteobacteria bacterium]